MDSLSLQRIRIPSILAVFMVVILMAGIVVGTQNISQIQKIFSSAQEGSVPSGSVETANITDDSFTVFWTTTNESAGAVFYGQSASLSDGVAVDERDLTNPNGKYTTHFVRISGLSEKTKYYFKVGASEATSGDPANGQAPFEVTTGAKLESPPTLDPIFGKVNKSSGSPASGAIAIWQVDGAGKIAALSKSDGTYVLPIATARSSDLNSYFTLENGQEEQIKIDLSSDGTSSINCTFGNDKPLPTVKLGESANCSNNTQEAALTEDLEEEETPTSSPSPTAARFIVPARSATQSTSSTSESTEQLNIVSGQSVSTPFPTISGKAGPKQMVKIEVHSDTPYSSTVIAGPDGSWSYTPPAGLSPGEHTVKITLVNSDGTTEVITRNFTVNDGEAILPLVSGTPSAEINHLACVNSACTTVDGTGVDSCSLDSDCTEEEEPPVTGSEQFTILFVIIGGIFLLVSGGFLVSNL